MSKRCFLFVCLKGNVSFWEYSEGALLPCSIHGETSFPKDDFWEAWEKQYRLEDDESRDFLCLSDSQLSQCDVPAWFFGRGVEISAWTHERLEEVFAQIEVFRHVDVVVEFCFRRSTVWHGGDPARPLILHGISTSELCIPEQEVEAVDGRKVMMKAFLSGIEEQRTLNERRCKSKR